jgi:hypothetical protein
VGGVGVVGGGAEFLFTTSNGNLWQTTISGDGAGQFCTDLSGVLPIPGPVGEFDGCRNDPFSNNYIFYTQDGHLWHTTHSFATTRDDTWTLEDLVLKWGAIARSVTMAAAAGASGATAQYLIVTPDGRLTLAERREGSWIGLTDVTSNFPARVVVIAGACADFQNSPAGFAIKTQWLFATHDGRLWHALYDGTWLLTDVSATLGIPLPSGSTFYIALGAAGNGGTGSAFFLFVTPDDGHLWWTKRLPDGSWTGDAPGTNKVDLTLKLGIPGQVHDVAPASQYAGIEPE